MVVFHVSTFILLLHASTKVVKFLFCFLSECFVKCHKYKPYTDKHSTKFQNPQADTAYTVSVNVEKKYG